LSTCSRTTALSSRPLLDERRCVDAASGASVTVIPLPTGHRANVLPPSRSASMPLSCHPLGMLAGERTHGALPELHDRKLEPLSNGGASRPARIRRARPDLVDGRGRSDWCMDAGVSSTATALIAPKVEPKTEGWVFSERGGTSGASSAHDTGA
jgi:hypothetical protein